jgi:anti-sigma factor RsiW
MIEMNCDRIQYFMFDYIDNELPASLQQEVEDHCAQCINCKTRIEEYKKTALLLQLRSVPDPGDAYFDTTWNVVRERMRARTVSLPDIRFSPPRLSWLSRFFKRPAMVFATAAAFVLTCIVGIYWLQQVQETNEYVDNDIEYHIVLPKDWQPERPDFGVIPAKFQPEVEFSAYSKAAIGGIDPISKSIVIRQVEAVSK